MLVLKPKSFAKVTKIWDKYNLSVFDFEHKDIECFLDKMNWLIENTNQVSEEDKEYVLALGDIYSNM